MADGKTEVQVTGRSKYEMAHQMAIQILTSIEGRSLESVSRAEYLQAHRDCIQALSGIAPAQSDQPVTAAPETST
jgi:hypothetical protein